MDVLEAFGLWIPVELLVLSISGTIGNLGVSLRWEKERSIIGHFESHVSLAGTSDVEDSVWIEAVVLLELEVFDEELLLFGISVSAVASSKSHSLVVSSWVSESDAEILLDVGVELHV